MIDQIVASKGTLDALDKFYRKPVWADGAISSGDAAFLCEIITRCNAKSVAEIGVASGVSTAFLSRVLAELNPSASLASFDLATTFYGDKTKRVGQFLWEEFGDLPPNVNLYPGVSSVSAAEAHDPNSPYEVVFVDGNHYDPWAAIDALCLLSRTAPGAWIVLHDVQLHVRPDKTAEFGPYSLFSQWPGEKAESKTSSDNIGAIRLFAEKTKSADALLTIIGNGAWEPRVNAQDKLAILRLAKTFNPDPQTLAELESQAPTEKGHMTPAKSAASTTPPAQGTETALDTLQASIEGFLMAALGEQVISRSSVSGVTITGNKYQTIRLNDKVVGGFRALRESLFKGFDFNGKVTCDLGSNLGEIARDIKRSGAALVDAYEYDKFFSQIANYVGAYNNIHDINYIAADVSVPGFMLRRYDITVSLSSYAYVGPNFRYICEQTNDDLIVETHEAGPDWADLYVKRLTQYFPHWCCYAIVKHGTGSEQKHRLWLTFSKKPLHDFYRRRSNLLKAGDDGVVEIDLAASELDYLKEASFLFDKDPAALKSGEALAGLRRKLELFNEAYTAEPTKFDVSMSGAAYWTAFAAGILEAQRGIPPQDTSYATWLRRGLDRGVIDPQLALSSAKTPVAIDALVSRRLRHFGEMVFGEAKPAASDMVTLFNTTPAHETLRDARLNIVKLADRSQPVCAPIIDGHHRIFVEKLLGRAKCLAMTIWDPSYFVYLPNLESGNYYERMTQYLANVPVSDPIIGQKASTIVG